VLLVVGTRPEAIKLAPVAHALTARASPPALVLTGQHPLDDLQSFDLEGFACVRLGCAGEGDPHEHVRRVTRAIAPLLEDPPRMLVVQGDTSSAMGGALAAFAANVPVAHVEAGLRTHDPALPWPEEEYRTAIDARAELLLAPTELAAENLRAENVPGTIHVTGNSGIDALLKVETWLPSPTPRDGGQRRILVTCHRRESWGEGMTSVAEALLELAGDARTQIDFVLHPNPTITTAMRGLVGGRPNITLLEPCSHRELVRRMRDSDLILSDSGGMQEEAPALGVPLLVLRARTERPEGIATGNMLLVGTDRDRIVSETRRLLSDPLAHAAMSRRALPYGDGHASERIAEILAQRLAEGCERERRRA
jgi:UDP-N-acetylglucosamine 2-epimerase (non-hydrolysing)